LLFEKPRPSQCLWSKWTDIDGFVAFQPDGEQISLASSDGRVEYFNREDGRITGKKDRPYLGLVDFVVDNKGVECFFTGDGIVRSHDHPVDYVKTPQFREANCHEVLSPDGRRMVLVRDDGTVTIINAVTAEIIARFEKLVSQDDEVGGWVAISPDSRRVAVQTEVTKVELIDLATGKRQGELNLQGNSLMSMCFYGGHSRLVIAGEDNIVEFDTNSLRPISTMPLPKRGRSYLRISPNGKLWSLAFPKPGLYFDGSLLILDRRDPKAQWRILPGVRNFARIAWHPKNPEMCLISEAGVLSYWDFDRKMSPEELTESIVPEPRPKPPTFKSPFPKPVGPTIKK
jgi:WD40 repeat protein